MRDFESGEHYFMLSAVCGTRRVYNEKHGELQKNSLLGLRVLNATAELVDIICLDSRKSVTVPSLKDNMEK